MKHNLFKTIFSSGFQAMAVQVLGAAFFYILSIYLSKEDFGLINTTSSIAIMLMTLLTFGLDQVIVRRIAASDTSNWAATAYVIHALLYSCLAFLVLLLLKFAFQGDVILSILPWFFAVQGIILIATPLKLFLNAKQRYLPYAAIAFISNIIKVVLALVLVYWNGLSIDSVVTILIVCAGIELVCLIIYTYVKANIPLRFKTTAYFKLLKESAPQYLVVVFDSSISRIDWILIGLISTQALTADYTYAYKAFEIARLPVTIIAPVILAKFARMLATGNKVANERRGEVSALFDIEIFLAILLPLVLNLLWTPVIDSISNGKYGSSNAEEFMILSICIPFQFAINLLWTLSFSGKKYKQVSVITITSAVVNLALNLALIPLYSGLGAGVAFLLTCILQVVMYYRLVKRNVIYLPVKAVLAFFAFGIAAYLLAINIASNVVLQVLLAVAIYSGLSFGLRQIGKTHLVTLKAYLSK